MSAGFVILSLPRSGSTTLAQLVNCHPDIRCLIEPFHPNRYGGKFHRLAVEENALAATLGGIWSRWNGIKHVYEAAGFPFAGRPELNEELIRAAGRVIFVIRRNLLRRFVSNYFSRTTRLWMGTRQQFHEKLAGIVPRPLDVDVVGRQLQRDREAIDRTLDLLAGLHAPVCTMFYEDVFREGARSEDRLSVVNSILRFLDFREITRPEFAASFESYFDPDVFRWATPDVYRRIPEIDRIENALGCDETGWLFR